MKLAIGQSRISLSFNKGYAKGSDVRQLPSLSSLAL